MSLFSNDYIVPAEQCVFWNSVGSMGAAFLTSLKVSEFYWGRKVRKQRNVKKGGIKYKGGRSAPLPLLYHFKDYSMVVSNHNKNRDF